MRKVVGAVALVAVVGAGLALYQRSQRARVEQADPALARARQSVTAGNAPLAQADLKRVVEQFSGTPAAAQAAMMLAQLFYDQGKPRDGIAALARVSSTAPKPFAASIEGLIGAGYEQLGRPADAASHYERAAATAALAQERSELQAAAARAYGMAGNAVRARALWTSVLDGNAAPSLTGEARVRLGELTVRPATPPAS